MRMDKLANNTTIKTDQDEQWAPIPHPVSSREALARLTKDQLGEIRKRYGIAGASSLKKQELIDVIADAAPQALPELLSMMDEPRYDVLKAVADRNGAASIDADILMIHYLEACGLLFRGSVDGVNMLVMPEELLAAFREADTPESQAAVRRNTRWIRIAQGLLFYYGVLSWPELKQLTSLYLNNPQEIETERFEPVIADSGTYQASITPTEDGVAHIDVMDAERIRQEQEQRTELPFYPFTKQQVLGASDPEHIDRNASFRAFVKYLTRNYSLTNEEAEEQVDQLVYSIQLGDSPSQIMEQASSVFELSDEANARDFVRLLTELMNHTRLWFLKGYTPNEAGAIMRQRQASLAKADGTAKDEAVQLSAKPKVGRNDPCPCGSGKKYKKCCGS